MKAKTIVLFNHKGGVSKTTTTYNLGWKLSQKGKKVLFVDGDPQCNLTSLFLGEDFYDYYEDETTSTQNIKDAVKMAFEGRPKPIQAINCFTPKDNANLFLIPGHMDLSAYDSSLSLALNSGNAITTLQNLPGAFFELIRLCAEKYDIDYVLIDMNPGLSAINQILFMMADGFIVPTNPDPFSIMALKTLKLVLPRWKKWAINSRELFENSAYPLPTTEMKFMGVIIQRFNLRRQRAAKPYQNKINEIKEMIESEFIASLEKVDMVVDLDELKNQGVVDGYCLAEISDFGALIQKANNVDKPVFALSDKDINETGTVLKQMQERRLRFDEIFTQLAEKVEALLK